MQMLLQMKVTDRNRQRPVRRRVLHHDQTTFSTLQVVDESPERPDGTASLRTVFDVFSLLPKTVKSPHYAAPSFPGTDCIICPWPVPNGYRLEQLLGPVFIQAALSHIRQHYLCGPAAYQCWLLPSTSLGHRMQGIGSHRFAQPSNNSVASCCLCATAAARVGRFTRRSSPRFTSYAHTMCRTEPTKSRRSSRSPCSRSRRTCRCRTSSRWPSLTRSCSHRRAQRGKSCAASAR